MPTTKTIYPTNDPTIGINIVDGALATAGAATAGANDGTIVTGETLETGGTGFLGWLSSIRKALSTLLTALVAQGTTASSKVMMVGGKSNDATAQYGEVPLGAGKRSVIVEGVSGGTAVPVSGSVTAAVTSAAEGATTDDAASISSDENTTARTGISLWKAIKNILIDISSDTGALEDAVVEPGTTAPDNIVIVGGMTSDGTPQYRGLPLSDGGSAVIVEGISGGEPIPVTLDIESLFESQVQQGTGAPDQVMIVGGKTNDTTPEYKEIPLGAGARSVIVEGNDYAHPTEAPSVVKFAAIAASSSGDNTLVSAVADKKIRVLSLTLSASAAVNARLQTAAAGAGLTGLFYLAANGGVVLPYNNQGWCETVAGDLLNLELSAAVPVGGCLTYIEV